MKILIIGFAKIKYMPYLNLYLESIDRQKNQLHLIYWNRDLKEEDKSGLENITLHEFRCFQPDDASKITKISSFLKFRGFAKTVLREGFDFVISLHSLPGIILLKELTEKYTNRYIYDYRDFTYENFGFYKKAVHTLVLNSYKTFVSSDGFRSFLPESEKIVTSHNISLSDISAETDGYCKDQATEKIRIAFWGFIREEKLNREIIEKIGGNERLELHYYGREQKIAVSLKKYVADKGYKNIFFHGEYNPRDRFDFAKKTDLIHNIYADRNMMSAVSNKYYDGVIFGIPQLLMTGSFMAQKAQKAGVGFAVNPYSESFTDDIVNGYVSIYGKNFSENCKAEAEKALTENKNLVDIIDSTLNGEEGGNKNA